MIEENIYKIKSKINFTLGRKPRLELIISIHGFLKNLMLMAVFLGEFDFFIISSSLFSSPSILFSSKNFLKLFIEPTIGGSIKTLYFLEF